MRTITLGILILVVLILGIMAGYEIGKSFSNSTSSPNNSTNSQGFKVIKYSVYLDGINFVDYYYPENLPKITSDNQTFLEFGLTANREPIINGSLNVSWVVPLQGNFEPNITLWTQNVKLLGKGWAAAFRQTVGCAVGPTYANGVVYVASNAGPVYAINVFTGKVIWELCLPGTLSMWMPLVYKGLVFLGLGGAMFDYQQGMLNAYGGGHRGQYTGVNGLLAINATTGKPIWFILTKSQAMPTGIIIPKYNILVWDDGDGNIYAVNPFTGEILWKDYYDGSANMASLVCNDGIIVAGFSSAYPVNTSALVGIYANNGSIAWIIKLPKALTSSVGDTVPAAYDGYLVDSFLCYVKGKGPYLTNLSGEQYLLIANITTGKIITTIKVSSVLVHPSDTNNGYNALVYNGIIYLPTVSGRIDAFTLQGKLLWKSPVLVNNVLQSAPVLVSNYLIVTAGENIIVLNASNGNIINVFKTPFIIRQQPIVVGNTIIETTSTNWVFAIPVSQIITEKEFQLINFNQTTTTVCYITS
ncbi:hypothetical protein EWF20_07385 [Sulfolobus sp. S-194]|uniref:outer membrane protein assembly factor BamB family protein n=1 Tax=Sulfolobus sp. S-194 TaxID=2512240 RepID=UPI0014370F6A|nr:PQQ-binding-like beta-propeller repeat protein [Sulfolobus sp. S-194]QIW23990.1 hypothetical protein EWF20_07385 [Sulfolobus sp. S-194]